MKNNIYLCRMRSGLKQYALGASIGRTQTYISKVENGVLKPPKEVLNTLAYHLQVNDPAYLLKPMDRRMRP